MDLIRQRHLGLRNRLAGEEGQTLAEYELLVALIAIVVIAAAMLVGPKISDMFLGLAGNFP
jgi:Flp pilus assembly pilin Flp